MWQESGPIVCLGLLLAPKYLEPLLAQLGQGTLSQLHLHRLKDLFQLVSAVRLEGLQGVNVQLGMRLCI